MTPKGIPVDQDPDLEAYIALRRQRFPHRYAAAILGWQPDHADRVRKRLEYRRAQNRTSLHQAAGAMRFGRLESIYFPSFSENGNSGLKIELVNTELQDTLNQARVKYDDLVDQSRAANAKVTEIEGRLAQLHLDAAADDAESIILGRAQNNWPKQISAVETAQELAKRLAISTAGAVVKQAGIVEGIQGQIEAQRFDTFCKTVAGPQERLDAAVLELLEAATNVQDIAYQHHFQASHYLVTPRDLPEEVHGRLVGVVRTALQAAGFWHSSYTNSPIRHKAEFGVPILIASPARRLSPFEVQLREKAVELTELTERFNVLYRERNELEREVNQLRAKTWGQIVGISQAPSAGDQIRLAELAQLIEAKSKEISANEQSRRVVIESKAALEKQFQEQHCAAVA